MSANLKKEAGQPSMVLFAGIFAWALVVVSGMGLLAAYGMSPGAQKIAPKTAPINTNGRPTLLVFVHPMCSCTNATLTELDKIASTHGDKLTIKVLCENIDPQWANSACIRRARLIRGVEVSTDLNGSLAKQFGALTSGFVVLYDATGSKVFQGGITESRAHEGDNDGEQAIDEYLSTGKISLQKTPAYGCALFGSRPLKL